MASDAVGIEEGSWIRWRRSLRVCFNSQQGYCDQPSGYEKSENLAGAPIDRDLHLSLWI